VRWAMTSGRGLMSGFKDFVKREKASIAALALLALSIALLLYSPVKPATEAQPPTVEKRLAELFVKTAIASSSTSDNLTYTYYQLPYRAVVELEVLEDLLKQYRDLYSEVVGELNPFITATSTARPPLQEKIMSAYSNYYALANASYAALHASALLEQVLPGIKSSLRELVKCNVSGALQLYKSIERSVADLEKHLRRARDNLSLVIKRDFLSENHTEVYEKLLSIVDRVHRAVSKYRELMELIAQSPEAFEKLCIYAKTMEGELGESEIGLGRSIQSTLRGVGDCGDFTNEVRAIREMINSVLKHVEVSRTSTAPASTTSAGGSGAGYYTPTETD